MISKKIDLTNGDITLNLFKLSIPIILTSLISICYNLIGILFVSYYLGDTNVSSVSAATFYITLSFALLVITKNGSMIYVAQSLGARKENHAKIYARVSILLSIFMSIIYMLICIFFTEYMILKVGVSTPTILYPAIDFLRITSVGFIFVFVSQTIASIINGNGDTFGPFIILSSGMIINIIVEYIFLDTLSLGIKGAAFATVISQVISAIMLYIYFKRKKSFFHDVKLLKLDKFIYYKNIIRIGFPSSVSQVLFSYIAIKIAQMIANVDEMILAVQRLGIQFESFTWNIAAGFSSAVSTFVGHNYGAKKFERVIKIYKVAVISIILLCSFITIVFVNYSRELFSLFFKDSYLIEQGVLYLSIVGLAQVPQGIEIITTGAFNGIGRTKEPNIIGIFGTIIRLPLISYLLPIFGIIGVWWTIHFSMLIKGIISISVFLIVWRKIFNSND